MGCCNTCSRRAVPPVCVLGPQPTPIPGPRSRRDKLVRPIRKRPFQGRTLYTPAESRDGASILHDSDIGEEEIPGLLLKYEEQQVRDFTSQVNKWKRLVRKARRLRKSQRLFNCTSEICKSISPSLSVSLHEGFPKKSLSDSKRFFK